ncbi:nucleotide exchange factor GrpE [Paenibacillus macquariensis]|uniref:Protein GrpE n=1 Tax=Paenibacillus macquariensis TaxID=948756 RepID=A0ABY1K1A8_9BACL|nr:nucleotide exchange factor GrpE [Paenibacillus macquariensis]MEC0091840.1 nucleotide exchange factor GrpE [Paenibacillus macquariensis]OAB32251.1 nucleotide exchange factor GrpE [Paenibacillus macquariensis subsp. macquariensis]SIR11051.1 molecular chaperone GrpE [Paenibacillus macquariensis]
MKEEQQDINTVPEDTITEIVEELNEEQSTSSLEQELVSTLELERLQALADENQQRVLRTQADFDNYRKRTQKEKEEFAKYASTKLITELLPIVDNFDRAFSTVVEDNLNESFSKGMNMIYRQLEGVLQAEGLVPMDSVGQPFNPEFHQAIMQVESEEYPEGTVVEEIQKGYMLKDKVLRPAMVKVSQ